MALSTQSVVSDGTLSVLDVSFEFYSQDEVSVVFDNEFNPSAWSWSGTQFNRILFTAPVPNGIEVFVYRTTAVETARHVFAEGAAFRAQTVDEDFEQILRVAQEFQDRQGSGLFRTDIDLSGHLIHRLGDAVLDTDAVNYGQAKAYTDQEIIDLNAITEAKLGYVIRAAEFMNPLPNIATRANKLLSFDSLGHPVTALPVSDSAQTLRLDLAAEDGDTLLGTLAGSTAVPRVQSDKNRDVVSFVDWLTLLERADAKLSTPVLDHTASMQACIDENKGKKIVGPAGYRFQAAGLTLNGATYDGTEVVFEGEFVLKLRPTSGSSTYQGAWVGLLFKDVSNASLTFRGDGRRSVQPAEEHIYLVGLAGVKNMTIPSFRAREVRGDGMYVSQSDWVSTSSNTDGVTVGWFEVVNSAADGRNALSIISGDNITIGALRSYNVGAVIGAVTQPGGLDIEPNHSGQSCKNIAVGSVNVVTAGTSGLAVQGVAGADVTRNVSVGVSVVLNNCSPSLNDGLGNLTITHNHTLLVRDSVGVYIKSHQGRFTAAYGDAIIVHESTDVHIDAAVSHVAEGARLGNEASSPNGLVRCTLNMHVTDTCRYGFRTGKLTGCRITGSVDVPTTGYYSGSLFGIICLASAQVDSEYSVNVMASSNWTRSYRNDATTPATFNNTVIRDCDLSGTWGDFTRQVGDMQVMRINVRGVTDRTTTPSVGTNLWLAGQSFVNTAAVAVGNILGWVFDGAVMRPTGYLSTVTALPTYAMVGSVRRSGDSSTITLPQLAEVVTTLVADLRAQGRLL